MFLSDALDSCEGSHLTQHRANWWAQGGGHRRRQRQAGSKAVPLERAGGNSLGSKEDKRFGPNMSTVFLCFFFFYSCFLHIPRCKGISPRVIPFTGITLA